MIIIDGATVITGSFNFTTSAESRNAENLLVIRDPQIAEKYMSNWQRHAAHAQEYVDRRGEVAGQQGEPERRQSSRGHKGKAATLRW